MLKVAIVMGSDSDAPIGEKAAAILRQFAVPHTLHIASAHRTPEKAAVLASSAGQNGYGVIIAIAGMAAHLAGFMAAHTILPVIGVPCKGGAADGLDALLSTLQMPAGVPVATVALNSGTNGALLAVQMLALSQPELSAKLTRYKQEMAAAVEEKDRLVQSSSSHSN